MSKLKTIEINRFQLNVLLNSEQKEIFEFILNQNVYCTSCSGMCTNGIEVTNMFLNSLNDIMVNGTCNTCKGNVAKILEFG
jgi:hypothetical protein